MITQDLLIGAGIALNRKLVWVYPPNKWQSKSNKTFVYGYSDPGAKLFVQTDKYLTPERINIFPNGNFAKGINLPNIENVVRLIQITNKKTNIIKRKIYIKPVGANLRVRLKIKKGKHIGSPLRHKNGMVIIIDPGHGGKEHGTHSPRGVPEKVFNLQIAKLLVEALRATPLHGKIYLTRTKDKFVSLKDRVDFAKIKRCDLLISIHHNALDDGEDPLKHTGVGIYYTNNSAKPLAVKLLNSICKESGLKTYGLFKRDFALTRTRFCKAVLIECGFLTHPVEAEHITRRNTQLRIATGIARALLPLCSRKPLK